VTDARPDLARRALAEGALVAGEWRHFWVYLAGPFAGAALGAFAYQLVRGPRPTAGRQAGSPGAE